MVDIKKNGNTLECQMEQIGLKDSSTSTSILQTDKNHEAGIRIFRSQSSFP